MKKENQPPTPFWIVVYHTDARSLQSSCLKGEKKTHPPTKWRASAYWLW